MISHWEKRQCQRHPQRSALKIVPFAARGYSPAASKRSNFERLNQKINSVADTCSWNISQTAMQQHARRSNVSSTDPKPGGSKLCPPQDPAGEKRHITDDSHVCVPLKLSPIASNSMTKLRPWPWNAEHENRRSCYLLLVCRRTSL